MTAPTLEFIRGGGELLRLGGGVSWRDRRRGEPSRRGEYEPRFPLGGVGDLCGRGRLGDLESLRLGDLDSLRLGDLESLRLGDLESLRLGDLDSLRLGDLESLRLGGVSGVSCLRLGGDLLGDGVSCLRLGGVFVEAFSAAFSLGETDGLDCFFLAGSSGLASGFSLPGSLVGKPPSALVLPDF